MSNQSSVTEFLLLDFSETREQQIIYFLVFLVLYLTTVTGNLLIISAIASDHHLHTPMYFFLINLAFLDLSSVSVIIPKSMANSLMNTRSISYSGCVTQILLFVFFISSEIFLLTVMAYDRFVAICNPLQYHMVMNRRACAEMVVMVWLSSLLYGGLHTSSTFATPFCSNAVNQFFCEIPHLIKLSCSDLNRAELGVLVFSAFFGLGSFVFVIVTYVHIFIAVLRMPSEQGRKKAFSTCLPHLIVFSTFILTACFAYFRPTSNAPSQLDFAITIIYSMIPPLLNPVIYSMRNKKIKIALSKLLGLRSSSQNTFWVGGRCGF